MTGETVWGRPVNWCGYWYNEIQKIFRGKSRTAKKEEKIEEEDIRRAIVEVEGENRMNIYL